VEGIVGRRSDGSRKTEVEEEWEGDQMEAGKQK
jgi:hypothetical protein